MIELDSFPHYQSTLSALRKASKPGMRFDLAPMHLLSERLDHPWKSFPSVLIAGTNGKGSTAAILTEILAQSGYTVGLYTSPHLSFYRERIELRGVSKTSSEKYWLDAFSTLIKSLSRTEHEFTEFELLTALSFLIFKNANVDIAILEVGMGGRLDATNVVEPLLSVITGVDFDHQQILGDTLAKIAHEKAGILREGKPALTLEQDSAVTTTLRYEAMQKRALLQCISPGELSSMTIEGQTFEYQGKSYRQKMIGIHQIANASLALEAAEQLKKFGFFISESRMEQGVLQAKWPARMEILCKKPIVLVDGAHNPQGCATLTENLKRLSLQKPEILVIGMLEDKNVMGMIQSLAEWGDRWIITQSRSPRAVKAEVLYDRVRETLPEKDILLRHSLEEACREALSAAKEEGTVCITGSLTTAGEARRLLRSHS